MARLARRRRIDKSDLSLPVPSRVRSPAHLDWIREQRCCLPGCGAWPVEAHHLTCVGAKGRGIKAGDDSAVPLCAAHHRGQDSPHHAGDEAAWWSRHGVDPIETAARFWRRSQHNGRTA